MTNVAQKNQIRTGLLEILDGHPALDELTTGQLAALAFPVTCQSIVTDYHLLMEDCDDKTDIILPLIAGLLHSDDPLHIQKTFPGDEISLLAKIAALAEHLIDTGVVGAGRRGLEKYWPRNTFPDLHKKFDRDCKKAKLLKDSFAYLNIMAWQKSKGVDEQPILNEFFAQKLAYSTLFMSHSPIPAVHVSGYLTFYKRIYQYAHAGIQCSVLQSVLNDAECVIIFTGAHSLNSYRRDLDAVACGADAMIRKNRALHILKNINNILEKPISHLSIYGHSLGGGDAQHLAFVLMKQLHNKQDQDLYQLAGAELSLGLVAPTPVSALHNRDFLKYVSNTGKNVRISVTRHRRDISNHVFRLTTNRVILGAPGDIYPSSLETRHYFNKSPEDSSVRLNPMYYHKLRYYESDFIKNCPEDEFNYKKIMAWQESWSRLHALGFRYQSASRLSPFVLGQFLFNQGALQEPGAIRGRKDAALFSPGEIYLSIENLREKVIDALTFYSRYHQNPVNQKIHTLCIPLIMWTTMVWLSEVPAWPTKNLTDLLSIAYFLGYCLYDTKLGAVSGVLLALFAKSAEMFAGDVPHPHLTALAVHVFAWVAQIYGHKEFEGNRPALLKGLKQSLYIAPLFSLIEACEFLGVELQTDKKNLLSSVSMFRNRRSGNEDGASPEMDRENNSESSLKKAL